MNYFTCPVCSELLNLNESKKSYICSKNHVFDRAKSGYVNLFQGKGNVHGDNKFMVNARKNFLEKGYYSHLLESLCISLEKYVKDGNFILDAGCGEGYYTAGIYNYFSNKNNIDICGIDISKTAVDSASKKNKNISYAVGSIFNMPVADAKADVIINIFAPFCQSEFLRVLKPDKFLVMVIPSENHLWSLKKAVYDVPYKNEVKDYKIEGFKFISSEKICRNIHLKSNQDIMNLFSMTPYYYKTGKKEQERLSLLDTLDTETEFEILIYREDC
ncbi:MAG: methyltransferase domain-containing protein [Oscillospiraceae bacterium]|nr:methyltransferase domain-containing protein [Oscillospiraceae bacterium]